VYLIIYLRITAKYIYLRFMTIIYLWLEFAKNYKESTKNLKNRQLFRRTTSCLSFVADLRNANYGFHYSDGCWITGWSEVWLRRLSQEKNNKMLFEQLIVSLNWESNRVNIVVYFISPATLNCFPKPNQLSLYTLHYTRSVTSLRCPSPRHILYSAKATQLLA